MVFKMISNSTRKPESDTHYVVDIGSRAFAEWVRALAEREREIGHFQKVEGSCRERDRALSERGRHLQRER